MLHSLDRMLTGISARPKVQPGAEDVVLEISTLDAKPTGDFYCVPRKCCCAALLQCLWLRESYSEDAKVNIPEKLLQGVSTPMEQL